MNKKVIRAAFRNLLIDQLGLPESKVFTSKFDRVKANRLPIIRIVPSAGDSERVASGSYDDSYILVIEVEAKNTRALPVDDSLDDFVDQITTAIRLGSIELDGLLHDYQVTGSRYTFDSETGDEIGSVSIDVECTLKP
ncbi:MAG: hypothetical protein AAFX93_19550 [Verrucomicrobiota bacterium]